MLHIHNGDASADTAKESSLAGEHLAWREALVTGPTPEGLSDDEWLGVRTHHLSEGYAAQLQECERSLRSQAETLAAFSKHDEVVLWFEHDLFCQVHLIYLLDWFSRRELGRTKLSLICIGEFRGKENFRGLGELDPEQLASLFPARQEVTRAQLQLAAAAWRAYCSANPTGIEKVLQTDTSPLPFLDPALRAHLERFPATTNGLGRIENRALRMVHDGLSTFAEVFRGFGEAEPVYGFGDSQFWLALRRMATASQPSLKLTGFAGELDRQALTPELAANAKFELTETGAAVLTGEADFVSLNGIDLWLGGVHLESRKSLWRWHGESGKLVTIPG